MNTNFLVTTKIIIILYIFTSGLKVKNFRKKNKRLIKNDEIYYNNNFENFYHQIFKNIY